VAVAAEVPGSLGAVLLEQAITSNATSAILTAARYYRLVVVER
jgi:hypothetical protein